MERNGVSDIKILSYDPKEHLFPEDAERELKLNVNHILPLGVKVNFEEFWREVGEIVKTLLKIDLLEAKIAKRRS